MAAASASLAQNPAPNPASTQQPGPQAQPQPQQQPQQQPPLPSGPPSGPAGTSQPPSSKTPTPNPDVLGKPLTLAAAIGAALKLQPNLTQAEANREISQQRLKQQETNYVPRITPRYQYQYLNTYGQVTRFLGGGVTTTNATQVSETRQGTVSLDYTVFDSFQRELGAKQARQALRGSRYSEENTRQSVIGNVATNYFDALRTAALVRVQEANVARAQNTLDVVNAQVEAGIAARKDVFQAQADLLNAQVDLVRSRNSAAIAQSNLKLSIGVTGGEPLQLTDIEAPTENTPITALSGTGEGTNSGQQAPTQTTPPQPVPQGNQPVPEGTPTTPGQTPQTGQTGQAGPVDTTFEASVLNRLSSLALSSRPDVAANRAGVEQDKTGVSIARVSAGLQATVTVSADYQYEPSDSNNRQLNLNLSYPLFDGGFARSQVRTSQLGVKSSEASLKVLEQQISVEVEQAYRNLSQARAALPAARAAQEAAQINYEAALESRREGVGSIVEVITAQTQLVQAQQSYVQAVYDFYTADAALARAVGKADNIARIGGEVAPAVQ